MKKLKFMNMFIFIFFFGCLIILLRVSSAQNKNKFIPPKELKDVNEFIIEKGIKLNKHKELYKKNDNVTLIGQWGNGNCEVVFIDSTTKIAYYGNGCNLEILDISDLKNPIKISRYILPSPPQDIYVIDNIAYVADGDAGLRIINVRNPSSPQEIGSYRPNGSVCSVFISGNNAYIANGNEGLKIIDICNPSNPIEVYNLNTNGDIVKVYVSGNFAYIADRKNGLIIMDISIPSNPVEINRCDIFYEVRDIFVNDDYIFIADLFNSIWIIEKKENHNFNNMVNFNLGGITSCFIWLFSCG